MPGGNYSNFRKKANGQVSSKTMARITTAISYELRNLGLTDAQIAEQIGIKPSSFARLKRLPIYRKLHTERLTGIVVDTEQFLKNNHEQARAMLNNALPTALLNLVKIATNAADEKLRLQASMEILDRQGHFAKVSRTGNALPEQGGVGTSPDDELATAMVTALQTITTGAQP